MSSTLPGVAFIQAAAYRKCPLNLRLCVNCSGGFEPKHRKLSAVSRLAKVFCRASNGLDAPLVRVEVHIAGGLPGITIVGLPEASVREARDRVRAALQSSGFSVPPSRITINLAPAELPKHGSRFDLAIALGILQASGVLDLPLAEHEFLAELSLDGGLRSVRGILPAASTCAKAGRRSFREARRRSEDGHGDRHHRGDEADELRARGH